MDGEFTFHNSTGFHTLAFERGTIQSVSGSEVVVRAPDGTTWTWLIVSDTVVRQNGSKTTTSALAQGQSVFVGGPVVERGQGCPPDRHQAGVFQLGIQLSVRSLGYVGELAGRTAAARPAAAGAPRHAAHSYAPSMLDDET